MSAINGTIMQYFHWYSPPEGTLWDAVGANASDLAQAGFTALWLPPAYKGSGGAVDVGYTPYDFYDLGEFDQKNTVRTKYGTRSQFLEAVKGIQTSGMQAYTDVVFNPISGGDTLEEMEAWPVDWSDRNRIVGARRQIKAYTGFTFPGRRNHYSAWQWHANHCHSVNHNALNWDDQNLYNLKQIPFETTLNPRYSQTDFPPACDLDCSDRAVIDQLKAWGQWFLSTTGVNGFRLDALNHLRFPFWDEWLDFINNHSDRPLFNVGECWLDDIEALHWWLGVTRGQISLFDIPLHYNFYRASKMRDYYDLRQVLNNTLMQQQPGLAVTFVDNHNSQPLQIFESTVEPWFKPLAYALILLRQDGYPCVFFADYYGAHYGNKGQEVWLTSHRRLIDKFLFARRHYAYGAQYDYFDHWNLIGWTRLGDENHPKAMAVLMSNSIGGSKWMDVGRSNTTFYDLTEHISEPVQTNTYGWGEFRCNSGSVSVWIEAIN